MTESDKETKTLQTFWNFLAYLQKIVDTAKRQAQPGTDPGRTRLLSMLAEYMCSVLWADFACVAYRSEDDPIDWFRIDKASVRPEKGPHWQSPLIKSLESVKWCFPGEPLAAIEIGNPEVYFDERLNEAPQPFRDLVTALAVARVMLLEREYFLFFCDVEEGIIRTPRYSNFDKAMLSTAIGLLEVGFQRGVRGGRRAERKHEVRQVVLGLVDEFDQPAQAVLTNTGDLQRTLPESGDQAKLRTALGGVLSGANQINLLVDTVRLAYADEEARQQTLVVENIKTPLQAAVDFYADEAKAKDLQIKGPYAYDEQPFPDLPLYPDYLKVLLKNLIRYASDCSLNGSGQYSPIDVRGHHWGDGFYAIEITSYSAKSIGEERTPDAMVESDPGTEEDTASSKDGWGVGLAFVKRAATQHKGQFEVSSQRVKQNVYRNIFRLILPIAGPRAIEEPSEYAVFLAYHPDDEAIVEALAHRLNKAGLPPWFSKWHLIPGEPRQEAIEKAMDICQTFVVFVGVSGLGPWQNDQVRSALEVRLEDKSRHVVPVLLPDAQKPRKDLPYFLKRVRWVKFESDLDDMQAFRELLSGIKREPPGPGAGQE